MRWFLLTFLLTGCSDWTFSRPLEGAIVSMGGRVASGAGMQEKVSLVVHSSLADDKIIEVAGGPSGVAVECLSTRCASLIEGTCHRFECKHEWRLGEPDVIACKHAKEIVCQPAI